VNPSRNSDVVGIWSAVRCDASFVLKAGDCGALVQRYAFNGSKVNPCCASPGLMGLTLPDRGVIDGVLRTCCDQRVSRLARAALGKRMVAAESPLRHLNEL
jgi:hypothetical protein